MKAIIATLLLSIALFGCCSTKPDQSFDPSKDQPNNLKKPVK